MIIRKADTNDINSLITRRLDYLLEERGYLTNKERAIIESQLGDYFEKHIRDGTFIAMLAEEEGDIVSCAYLAISEKPANVSFMTGKTGTLLNVLTYPNYRGRGAATKVITALIDEAKKVGVSMIELAATDDGRPLYEKLGFQAAAYTAMRMTLS